VNLSTFQFVGFPGACAFGVSLRASLRFTLQALNAKAFHGRVAPGQNLLKCGWWKRGRSRLRAAKNVIDEADSAVSRRVFGLSWAFGYLSYK
jgi:hypothetical protein